MRLETITTVCSFDPEIDKSKISLEDFTDYLNKRDDIGRIRHAFKPSGPTEFTIREIPHELWEAFVERGDTDAEKYRRAFMCGVSSVRNLYQTNGTRLAEWSGSDTQTIAGKQYEMLAPADLALFPPTERQEIGMVAYAHSGFHRRIDDCFQLPPMSHRRLAVQASLHAEPSPTLPAKPKEPSSAGREE